MRMFLRLAFVFLISLWLGSVAYADKICPVDSEVYPDSVQYCIQHGNKLIPKKPSPKKHRAKAAGDQTGRRVIRGQDPHLLRWRTERGI